jgi:thiamine biosynthesis lipoprotein
MTLFSASHEAMATTFRIAIAADDREYARQAAATAFRELDRLETELSRFIESSDIAQANRLPEGGTLLLGPAATECLTLAAHLSALTEGAFDPAYASTRPAAAGGAEPPLYALDPDGHRLTSLCPRLHLDLGAVGKGYALDCMAAILSEWELPAANLDSGGSTLLALAPPPGRAGWAAAVGEGAARREFALCHRALAGSGIAVQGEHLRNPRTGGAAGRRERVWAFAPTAAAADALSTAFFVMDDEAIADCCAREPSIGAVVTRTDGALVHYGLTIDA